ncbi:hypothetical protein B0H10DRAFT_2049864 [Mycena sp. CBHHK59/15]|nr:hypothetical protein B0H10DRAFT_2049864 [Mycena sp. CBHHK59/15]
MTETLSDTQIQGQLYISRYLILVPFTILLYDYVLTLDQEVARFWCKGLTWGSFFFYLNRYTSLFGTIPILVEFFLTTTDPSKKAMCKGFESYHQYFALLSQVMVAIMLIMRTYALYERKKIVLAFTILVTVGAAAFALWVLFTGVTHDTLSSELRAFGCPSATPHDTNLRTAAAWSGLLIFDVMIFSLTLYKALTHHARRGDLLTVLIRDGSVYFSLMIVSNACNIGTYTMSGPLLSGSATSLTNVVSSVMISRLMLNLRDPGIRLPQRRSRSRATTTADDSPAITTFLRPYLGTEFATTIDSGRVDTAGEQSNVVQLMPLR